MKDKEVTFESSEDFLARGGTVEILPSMPDSSKYVVNNTTHKTVNLTHLADFADMHGEKPKRKVKTKKVDVSDVDMSLIPDHIKRLLLSKIGSDITKENE